MMRSLRARLATKLVAIADHGYDRSLWHWHIGNTKRSHAWGKAASYFFLATHRVARWLDKEAMVDRMIKAGWWG